MITLVYQVDKPCGARLKEAHPQTRFDEAVGGKALLSGECTKPPPLQSGTTIALGARVNFTSDPNAYDTHAPLFPGI